MPYCAVLSEVEKRSGIRIRHRITNQKLS